MNRTVITCTLALLGLASAACESTVACPEGYTYSHDRRLCVFTGDAGSGGSGAVDAGSGATDAGQPTEDAGESDAGELDAAVEPADDDAGTGDAGADADAGTDAGTSADSDT